MLYGVLGDRVGVHWATVPTALVALAILPLAFALAPQLAEVRRGDPQGRTRPAFAVLGHVHHEDQTQREDPFTDPNRKRRCLVGSELDARQGANSRTSFEAR